MTQTANSRTASSTTGTLLRTDSQPKSAGKVIYCEFSPSSTQPLTGSKPLAGLMRKYESNPQMAARLQKARRDLGELLEPESSSLRALRLAAGLSQTALAERVGNKQSYVARIEAGKLDPGTDMLARLAEALGLPAEAVFTAIRAQRGRIRG